MAALGLVVGFESRGGLLGVGVPTLGVGVGWAAARVSTRRRWPDALGDAVGAVSLLLGAVTAILAARVIAAPDPRDLSPWVGGMLRVQAEVSGRSISTSRRSATRWRPGARFCPSPSAASCSCPRARRVRWPSARDLGRLAVVVGSAVALVAHGYLAARMDLIAFTGPALCAVACAVAIRDFERGARASIAVGLGTLLLAGVLHHDFHELPEKAYQAFAVTGPTFPESFKNTALDVWWVVLGGFALVRLLHLDRSRREALRPFEPSGYASVAPLAP